LQSRSGLIKFILSLMLLAIVLAQLDLNELWRVLQAIDRGLFGLSALAYLAGIVIRAYRWQLLFRALGERISLRRLTELYLIGTFFNRIRSVG
jgi:uncharacterized protein (TIRG00374 family)